MSSAAQRREDARETNGQFGEQRLGSPSDVNLVIDPVPFVPNYQDIEEIDGVRYAWMPDSGGEVSAVRMDVIDDETVEIYRRGQCLALAIETHRATGWPIVGWLQRDMGDIEEYDLPIHFWVRSPDGRLLDVGGYTDEDIAKEEFGPDDRLVEYPEPVKPWNDSYGYLAEQDFATAQHFVPAVIARANAIDRGEFDPQDEWPVQ